MTLPRMEHDLIQTAMFIRPRDPDDHRQFEWLLPRCAPMFVYADENGRDWVRWSIPRAVADQMGWDMKCHDPNCRKTEEATHEPQHAYVADMAYDEIDWFLERLDA
jgi:hypothetical protein